MPVRYRNSWRGGLVDMFSSEMREENIHKIVYVARYTEGIPIGEQIIFMII